MRRNTQAYCALRTSRLNTILSMPQFTFRPVSLIRQLFHDMKGRSFSRPRTQGLQTVACPLFLFGTGVFLEYPF